LTSQIGTQSCKDPSSYEYVLKIYVYRRYIPTADIGPTISLCLPGTM